MPTAAPTFDRPQRWDAAFDPEMSDATVDRLLGVAPFSKMRPENFPKRASLRDVLKHDTRVRTFPSNLVAAAFGFREREFFELREAAQSGVAG